MNKDLQIRLLEAREQERGREYNDALRRFYETGSCADRLACINAMGALLDASREHKIALGEIATEPHPRA